MPPARALLLALCSAGIAAAQEPGSADACLVVVNASDAPRREIVRAPVPLARGEQRQLHALRIDGRAWPAVPLAWWGDGSIAVTQVHLPLALAPRERRELRVQTAAGEAPALDNAGVWPWESAPLPFHTEILDPWGQSWIAALTPEAALVPPSSPLVRVQRCTGVHRRGAAESLAVVAWLTTFRGERRAELTLALDNGAHWPERPALGPMRLRAFTLVSADPRVRLRPRFIAENALAAPLPEPGGGFRQALLGPSAEIYLGDRTAKAFCLDLFLDDAAASDAERAAAAAAADAPLRAWPALDWVRRTRAFGAHGGPAPASVDQSATLWRELRQEARFGPLRGHGDPEDAAAQGTPRNGPSALHNALRWQSADLLAAAHTMVLQHGLRPTPGTLPRLPEDSAPFRAGLSRRCRERPHGFTPLDYEHFSVDLLYDYWWLTGDPWAHAELRRAGSGLLRVLDGVPFRTSRGEGWCLQAGVLIARATGERELVAALDARLRERVLPGIGAPPACVAVAQPPDERAFGPGVAFDAPWQMAALVHGLHALWQETGDAALAEAAVRVARMMAGPGWVEDVGPKSLVSAADPGRYTLPMGFGPLEGTATMQSGAFVLAAEMAAGAADRALLARRAHALVRARQAAGGLATADRWLQLALDRQGSR